MTPTYLPFREHIEELRKTLIRCLLTILLGSIVAFFFHEPLLQFLLSPLEKREIQQQQITSHEIIEIPKKKLALFNPLEGFLIAFKLSVWTGCLATSPLWFFFLLQFLLPALKAQEKRLIFPFLILSVLFIGGGVFFAYSITLPVVTTFFTHFNEGIGENVWHLGETLNFAVGLVIAHGIVFELFVLLLLLIYYRIVSEALLRRNRPKVIVAVFILAAILTPPDIFSQLLLALPMLVLYEIAVILAKFRLTQNLD